MLVRRLERHGTEMRDRRKEARAGPFVTGYGESGYRTSEDDQDKNDQWWRDGAVCARYRLSGFATVGARLEGLGQFTRIRI
jgi:hypothetical protein